MENKGWIDYKIKVRERLRLFALKILELSELLPNTNRGRILNNQLTRSGTSVYANYRATIMRTIEERVLFEIVNYRRRS
ncbi:MAG: hypothetical protein COC06_09970 [Bacteroidales bacterium]|nr:MAG: hypothetical protein COC06_09970 [Bacteroidales bacterium]